MKSNRIEFVTKLAGITCGITLLSLTMLSSCSEDPQPVNEEELITTLIVDLTPTSEGDAVQLKFYDEDGEGALDPVITPNLAQLTTGKTYTATLTLKNESVTPADDVTLEIEEEKNDHLFCFAISGTDVTVGYDDEDDHGNPVGLQTRWTTGDAGDAGTVTITLRHQPDTKDGSCPGSGDTDIEVSFNVQIVN